MIFRLRTVGAVLALLAFSAYFAEGLWASMCPPDVEMMGVEMVDQQTGSDGHFCPVPGSEKPSDDPDPSDQVPSNGADCPIAFVGVSGSCVAASLPAPAVQMDALILNGSLLSISPDAARDLLLATVPFHPPRA